MIFNNHNVFISPRAKLGVNVRIGDNTSIYDNVEIGDNTTITDHCVIGEPLADYYKNPNYENPPTRIGANSLIRSRNIIYAACEIGPHFNTGHWVTIREKSVIGEHCMIGTLSDLQGYIKMGSYCRLHSNVHISQYCTIGDFVFLYPFVVMTNDPCPPSAELKGGHIASYTQVGVHVVTIPGVKIGENCLIGAASVVTKAIPDYSLAIGNPCKVMMDIREYAVLGKGKPYPWMKRFTRGMPWEEMGYEKWMAAKAASANGD